MNMPLTKVVLLQANLEILVVPVFVDGEHFKVTLWSAKLQMFDDQSCMPCLTPN